MIIYFLKTWLVISIFSILISGGLLYNLFDMQNDEKSLFFTILFSLSFFYSLRFVFILTISSILIFLNTYEPIKKNWFYSLLTYCLVPFGLLISFRVDDILAKDANFNTMTNNWEFPISLILPHLIISLISYFHFRKTLKNKDLS